jgi:polyisoprenoid-binding protein YceI
MRRLVVSALLALAVSAPALASNWEFDGAHSSAEFKIRHLMISNVTGKFAGISGKVELDDADVTKSKIEANIDVSTVNTDNEKRDAHLKSPDFFDVAKFPKMTFKSTSITKEGSDLKVHGELTMHGVTKPVTLDVTSLSDAVKDPFGGTRRGLTASTKINRKEFGLTWNKALETGGVMVGDDVQVTIDAELVKK